MRGDALRLEAFLFQDVTRLKSLHGDPTYIDSMDVNVTYLWGN
jgi:hypothetical protein